MSSFLHASQPDGKQQVWERREGGFPVLENITVLLRSAKHVAKPE